MEVNYLMNSDWTDRANSALKAIITSKVGSLSSLTDYKTLRSLVRNGFADKVFSIGDQLSMKWYLNDNTSYDLDWDVVDIANVINKNGESVPGLWLQSHWALPAIQFDGNEAFWYCETALSAGTYNVTMGNNWGSNVVSGKVYQFTLTQDVPQGGQLVFTTSTSTTGALPDQTPSNWRVRSYQSSTSTAHIEMVEVSEGNEGVSLGTLSSSTKYASTGLNNMQRSSYGYNRWSQSGMRQWLNSDKSISSWWEAQNVYDRPPDQLTSVRGFMAGLPEDFLEIIEPVQVVTALNAVSDSEIGTSETTYDRFFLPSLEQEYVVPQLAGVEGKYFPYWKDRLNLSSPQKVYQSATVTNANANHIRYDIANHSSAQHCRLRSAVRGCAYGVWNVSTSGSVSGSNSTTSYRPCPACVIC